MNPRLTKRYSISSVSSSPKLCKDFQPSQEKSNMQVSLMELFTLSEATTIESRITIQAMYVKSSVCASKMCCNIFSKTSGRMALFFYWKLASSFKKTKPTETAGIP